MTQAVLLYSTWPDADEAEAAGRRLINERLAACVNIFPQGRSIWRDGDELASSTEVVMIIKTDQTQASAACARACALHPYDVPAIIAASANPSGTNQAYTDWLGRNLGA